MARIGQNWRETANSIIWSMMSPKTMYFSPLIQPYLPFRLLLAPPKIPTNLSRDSRNSCTCPLLLGSSPQFCEKSYNVYELSLSKQKISDLKISTNGFTLISICYVYYFRDCLIGHLKKAQPINFWKRVCLPKSSNANPIDMCNKYFTNICMCLFLCRLLQATSYNTPLVSEVQGS